MTSWNGDDRRVGVGRHQDTGPTGPGQTRSPAASGRSRAWPLAVGAALLLLAGCGWTEDERNDVVGACVDANPIQGRPWCEELAQILEDVNCSPDRARTALVERLSADAARALCEG